MSISRTATGGFLTDDGGTGTTGTVLNNADRQAMLDLIDKRWTDQVISLTGSQNNVSITSSALEADRVNLTNASALTITGIAAPASPAKAGKPLDLYSTGVGGVTLVHESASSTAANRIVTDIGGINLALVPARGKVRLVYDSTNSRWRVVSHTQGGLVSYTTTWSAASGTAPAIGNGTITAGYAVNFATAMCYVEIILTAGTTTTFGNGGQLRFSLPFTSSSTYTSGRFHTSYTDTGTASYLGVANLGSTTTLNLLTSAAAIVTNTAPFTFGSTDIIQVAGWYALA